MRFLIILAALAVAAVVVVLVVYALGERARGASRRAADTGWETHTESSGGVTRIIVRQVSRDAAGGVAAELGRQVVASIPDGDPDWETRYFEAMAQARSRVAALEIESG